MAREDDVDVLARTCYGEMRGQGMEGLHAVANVVVNRVNSGITWWGKGVQGVCQAPFQFSCWLANDPNLPQIKSVDDQNPVFRDCIEVAKDAVDGLLEDITNGATSYYADSMPEPPKWAIGKSPCATMAETLFFKDVL